MVARVFVMVGVGCVEIKTICLVASIACWVGEGGRVGNGSGSARSKKVVEKRGAKRIAAGEKKARIR